MNIPNKVKIGFKDYVVNRVDGPVISDRLVCYGDITYDTGVIRLQNVDLSEDMEQCAFIHECVHGIDDVAETNLTEEQVEKFSKGLYALIKDNPEIFKK
jgi:hypothetical protein